jgi:hypothetical protein
MAEAKPRPATRHCPRPFIRCFRGNHRNRKLVGSDPVPAPMARRLPCPYATAPDRSPARAADLVTEAIRVARAGQPRAEITGSRWQASTAEVRDWAADNGFQIGADGTIPEQAIAAYNQTHHGRPY